MDSYKNKIKYKKFVFVHTIANKVSGILLYFLPIILFYRQNEIIVWIIWVVVFIAAMEELLITIKYPEANLNRISVFCK